MDDGTDFRDKNGGGQFSACAELNNPHPSRNKGSYALEKEQKTPTLGTCDADDTRRLAITIRAITFLGCACCPLNAIGWRKKADGSCTYQHTRWINCEHVYSMTAACAKVSRVFEPGCAQGG